jgi:SSS family transporter
MIYVSAQIFATGEAFNSFLDINFMHGAILGFIIVLVYSSIGGFVAVAWSDLFQGLVMLAGLVLLPIVAWSYLPDGQNLSELLNAQDESLTNIWGKGGFTITNLFTILSFSLIGLGFLGSPQIFVRFMSIKDENEINKGRWVAIAFTIITDSAAVLTGILGRALLTKSGVDAESILGNDCEGVLPILVDKVMPGILIGIYIAAVLSAIMSTVDSLLVVASSAITRDLYQKVYNPELADEMLAKLSKYLTVIFALLALGLALAVKTWAPGGNIFWFAIFGWSGLAATFCPTMIMSLFWNKFNEKGAIAAMIVGFTCVPLFKFVINELPHIGPYFTKLDVLAPSFLISFLVGIVVANMTHKNTVIQ